MASDKWAGDDAAENLLREARRLEAAAEAHLSRVEKAQRQVGLGTLQRLAASGERLMLVAMVARVGGEIVRVLGRIERTVGAIGRQR